MEKENIFEKSQLIYAGRRKGLVNVVHVYYEVEETVRITERWAFDKCMFNEKKIGLVYDVELDKSNSKIRYGKKEKGFFNNLEDRVQLISEWRREDDLVTIHLQEKKALNEIHKFKELDKFKQWYRTKSTNEKQHVVIDLINFLNK